MVDHSSGMTFQDAYDLAYSFMNSTMKNPHEWTIERGSARECEFGWVFYPVPKRYIESRDTMDLVPGVGQLIVDRVKQSARFLPTNRPPDVMLKAYYDKWLEENKN